jgi:NAD(P)-dependent dehydrogenase (short-subunit alcohol dehydrogenase family)
MRGNRRWTVDNMPNLAGKVAVVTGANSGLGYEVARALASKGATVVLAVRDPGKGSSAVEKAQADCPDAALHVIRLDLAELNSIHAFAEAFGRQHSSLDILVNNAGLMATPFGLTADGFEMQFGVNHLGHFALTGMLLPQLRRSVRSRVVTVSSGMHWFGKADFDQANDPSNYGRWQAYGRSKLANLLSAYELQRKFDMCEIDAISVASHPGYAATNLQSTGVEMDGSKAIKAAMSLSNRFFAQSAAMGALPILYAATALDVAGGDYIGPRGLFEARGYPHKVASSGASLDLEAAARLWAVSEKLTGVGYDLC